jgi:hypothetical protein
MVKSIAKHSFGSRNSACLHNHLQTKKDNGPMKNRGATEPDHQGYEVHEKVFQSQLQQIGLMSMNLHGVSP